MSQTIIIALIVVTALAGAGIAYFLFIKDDPENKTSKIDCSKVGLNLVPDDNNQCVCPDTTFQKKGDDCIKICDSTNNYVLNATKDACVCKADYIEDSSGTCVRDCDANKNRVADNDECICMQGFFEDINEECIRCESPKTFDTLSKTCNLACIPPKVLNSDGSACVCQEGYIKENTDCVIDCSQVGSNLVPDDNNQCVCPDTTFQKQGDDCIKICDSTNNYVPNATKDACVCRADYIELSSGICVRDCDANKNRVADNDECICKQGFFEDINEECIRCESPKTFDTLSKTCNLACIPPKVPNSDGSACVCKGNKQEIGDDCGCLDGGIDVGDSCVYFHTRANVLPSANLSTSRESVELMSLEQIRDTCAFNDFCAGFTTDGNEYIKFFTFNSDDQLYEDGAYLNYETVAYIKRDYGGYVERDGYFLDGNKTDSSIPADWMTYDQATQKCNASENCKGFTASNEAGYVYNKFRAFREMSDYGIDSSDDGYGISYVKGNVPTETCYGINCPDIN